MRYVTLRKFKSEGERTESFSLTFFIENLDLKRNGVTCIRFTGSSRAGGA